MKITPSRAISGRRYQQGMTLIELLVAGVISLIAVAGMVIVMATTLGTTTQTIEMTRLTQEMRTAMQIMTRELRRANYHPGFIACYGNTSCLADLGLTTRIGDIQIGDSVTTNDCFWFWYDRPQAVGSTQIAVTAETVAAFRLAETNSIGRIQMTTTRSTAPSCTSSADWVDITDPNVIDVQTFVVSNTTSITETINTVGDIQNVQKIGLAMTARLTNDVSVPAWIQSDANPARGLVDFIKVRNNTTTPAP